MLIYLEYRSENKATFLHIIEKLELSHKINFCDERKNKYWMA